MTGVHGTAPQGVCARGPTGASGIKYRLCCMECAYWKTSRAELRERVTARWDQMRPQFPNLPYVGRGKNPGDMAKGKNIYFFT